MDINNQSDQNQEKYTSPKKVNYDFNLSEDLNTSNQKLVKQKPSQEAPYIDIELDNWNVLQKLKEYRKKDKKIKGRVDTELSQSAKHSNEDRGKLDQDRSKSNRIIQSDNSSSSKEQVNKILEELEKIQKVDSIKTKSKALKLKKNVLDGKNKGVMINEDSTEKSYFGNNAENYLDTQRRINIGVTGNESVTKVNSFDGHKDEKLSSHSSESQPKKQGCFKKVKGCCTKLGESLNKVLNISQPSEGNIWIESILKNRQEFKPWKEMNKIERKEKIKYLWGQIRRYFWQQVIIIRMKTALQSEVRVELVDDDRGDEGNSDDNLASFYPQIKAKWYLINESYTMPQAWSFMMYIFTIYTLFATPYIGYFIFDFLSVVPSYISYESKSLYIFKLARFVHTNRLFSLFKFILVKFLLNRGYNRMKVQDYASLLTLMIFVIFITHILACIWIYFGRFDDQLPRERRKTWIYKDPTAFDETNLISLYIFSIYFILQTLTTVGYGDHTGCVRDEYIFCMCLEFIGLSLFSFLMGSINNMISKDDSFESLLDQKISMLDIWIKKIEKSNKPNFIPPELYSQIKKYVQDAFLHDFNLIIEEFPFYHQCSPKMQSELTQIIFKDFQQQFNHFFQYCERGFINEFIINMYCRIYQPETTVVQYGQKLREIFFIREGCALMYNKFEVKDFMMLPQYGVFGDYQIIYDLKSNITMKTPPTGQDVRFMCISKKVFLNLCELFPTTAENLRVLSLKRRYHFIQAMELQDMSSPLKALHRSIKKRIKQKADDDSKNPSPHQTSRKESILSDQIEIVDEDALEQFFSDEEPKLSIEDEETPEVVIKKISKKTTRINLSMNTCLRHMDYNFDLLKKYLKEGRSKNPESVKLKNQVTVLSGVFQSTNVMRSTTSQVTSLNTTINRHLEKKNYLLIRMSSRNSNRKLFLKQAFSTWIMKISNQNDLKHRKI
ncbi:cation channel family protein [Stylonychia lemnae]|uniref:Cation channel family protein n=1 Tax=Stylonychia lemnae TaxID=5949 RepID=A0A078B9I1_STYLE|nr:cation channel family protein [Stylonychia lemnae]|eukprot:CDW90866.1 cation channel family protein [Stylonychia lemnae]